MADDHVIQVRLPDGAQPAPEDIQLLRAIFEAIVTLAFAHADGDRAAEAALTADGWKVRTGLRWVAEATRGGECEQVTGASKAEALEHLQQFVRAERVLSAL